MAEVPAGDLLGQRREVLHATVQKLDQRRAMAALNRQLVHVHLGQRIRERMDRERKDAGDTKATQSPIIP